MPKQRSGRPQRYRLTTPSGQTVTLADRGPRGWQLDFKRPGEQRMRISLGQCSREEAARRAIDEVDRAVRRQATPDVPTLARVAAEMIVWKTKNENRAHNYTRMCESHLRGYLLPELGADTRVDEITAAALLQFKHKLGASDLDPKSCNRILTTLRQVLKFAEDPRGYCTAPALPRNFPTNVWDAAQRWHLLEPQEIQKLLSLAPDDVRACLGFIANTGVRVGTALATEASWIDWRHLVVRYPATAMKGRYVHTVDLNETAKACLKAALAVSPEQPFPFSYWYLLKRWLPLREAAGYPDLRLHDLRHSFVSNQLAAGTPIHVVRDMAAHRSLSVTALYAHSTDEARRAASQRVQINLDAVARVTSRVTKRKSTARKYAKLQVPRDGIEPPTRGFSILCSTD